MPTPHIAAEQGQIAPTVLMPGDPLRARFIADTYLDGAEQFNNVRGMLGFTGRYKGARVSVMGSGMGMPSIGIYSYELYSRYGVENIIRVGSAGAYAEQLQLFDVLLVTSAYSESSYARTMSGFVGDITYPAGPLCEALRESAAALKVPLAEGRVHSSDVFYREGDAGYWRALNREHECLAVEMESFALFHNAQVLNKQAACLLTISDSFATGGETSSAERERGFATMMEVALGAGV